MIIVGDGDKIIIGDDPSSIHQLRIGITAADRDTKKPYYQNAYRLESGGGETDAY
jgi:hypothetical protein